MRRRHRMLTCLVLALTAAGCSDDGRGSVQPMTFAFDLQSDMNGWQALFADYPAGANAAEQASIDVFYELSARHVMLPHPLNPSNGAIELVGSNHSDDLQMVLKRQLTGLAPTTDYTVDFTFTIASNVPKNCAGIGGAPGEAVLWKVGASTAEPARVPTAGPHPMFRLTIDIGQQGGDGADGRTVGNFANSKDCGTGVVEYELKTLSSEATQAMVVRTDRNGGLWVVVATDSGFEGLTRAYVDHITVTAVPD